MFCFCPKYSTHSRSALLWGLLRLPVLKNALLLLWEISQPFEINISSDRFYFYAVTHLTTGLLRLVQERTDTSADSARHGRCEGSPARHGCPAGRCSPGPFDTLLGSNTTRALATLRLSDQLWSSKGETKSPWGVGKPPTLSVKCPQTWNPQHRGSIRCRAAGEGAIAPTGPGAGQAGEVPERKLVPQDRSKLGNRAWLLLIFCWFTHLSTFSEGGRCQSSLSSLSAKLLLYF